MLGCPFLAPQHLHSQNPEACLATLRASREGTKILNDPEAGQGAVSAEAPQPNRIFVSRDEGTNNSKVTSDGQNLHQLRPCLAAPSGSPNHILTSFPCPGQLQPSVGLGLPYHWADSRTPCFPVPGETAKPVLQAWWERLVHWSYLSACEQLLRDSEVLLCAVTEHRSPGNMAATDLVEEIHSVGERLLQKLQGLPQAEPVELVAFSIIVLFTATVLLLLLIACSCCCVHCCCPERRDRKIPVRAIKPR